MVLFFYGNEACKFVTVNGLLPSSFYILTSKQSSHQQNALITPITLIDWNRVLLT